MSEHCSCTGRAGGFHQHPDFLDKGPGGYVFEFFVCGECDKPTALYLAKAMERAE